MAGAHLMDQKSTGADHEELPPAPVAGELAQVLALIAVHDEDYEVRYPLVWKAVSLALEAGYPAGVRIDLADVEWPVAYIELPVGGDPGPPIATDSGLVSTADRDLLQFRWYDNGKRYWKRHPHLPAPTGYIHRVIAERLFGTIPEGYEVDHIDRDPSNNTRWNLRLATPHMQKLNLGRVSVRQRRNGHWSAFRQIDGRQVSFGMAETEREATLIAHARRDELVAQAFADGEVKTWPAQISWHMPQHPKRWDGHTTEEKYRRVREFAALASGKEA